MKEMAQINLLVTHVVIVRFFDEELGEDRRLSLYAYGADAARCLALTLTGVPFHFISTVAPYAGSTRAYRVQSVEWAPL